MSERRQRPRRHEWPGRTEVSWIINAPLSTVYCAFQMSLIYPSGEAAAHGKSADGADTFAARFAQLVPDARIVWAVTFDSPVPAFAGEMTVRTTLEPAGAGTRITLCEKIPSGIRPEDDEAAAVRRWRSSPPMSNSLRRNESQGRH